MRKEIVDYTRTQKIPKATQAQATAALVYSTPPREIDIQLAGRKEEVDLLDKGSEIVVVRKDVWEELGFKVNPAIEMTMQTANEGKGLILECAENLEIEAKRLKTRAHSFVVPQAPYKPLLGQPWQKSVKLAREEYPDGRVDATIHNPLGLEIPRRIPTTARAGGGSSFVMNVEAVMKEPNTTMTTLTSVNPEFTDPPLPLSGFLIRSVDYYDHG